MDDALPRLILILLALWAAASILWSTLRTGISPMPSSNLARHAMLDASAVIGEGAIIECGSGWGGLLVALARRYPDRRVIGYELSLLPWLYSAILCRLLGLTNVEIYRRDFLKADLSGVSLICCYLYPGGMQHLADKLAAEPQPGVVLISNTFALPGHDPVRTVSLEDLHRSSICIYRL